MLFTKHSLILYFIYITTFFSVIALNPFSDDSYKFEYSIDETKGVLNVNLDVDATRWEGDVALTGWVGIGFSDNGNMANSDLVLCYIDTKGRPVCHDGFAQGYTFQMDET